MFDYESALDKLSELGYGSVSARGILKIATDAGLFDDGIVRVSGSRNLRFTVRKL